MVAIGGKSNAQDFVESLKRTAVVYIGWYVIFVVIAAVQWWGAVPVKKDGEG